MNTYRSKRRIEVQSNYGTIIAYVDETCHPNSDEDSTEPVVKHIKPETSRLPLLQVQKVAIPAPTSVEEDEWMELNQDFARDNSHEDIMPERKPVGKNVQVSVSTASDGDYDMWGENNEIIVATPPVLVENVSYDMWGENSTPFVEESPVLIEESDGDYDMWGENSMPTVEETSQSMDEDIWWQMNQNFACEGAELYMPSKMAKVKPAVARDVPSTPTPSLNDDEWMEMNQDFARDSSHVEVAVVVKTRVPSASLKEGSYGDYDLWGECE